MLQLNFQYLLNYLFNINKFIVKWYNDIDKITLNIILIISFIGIVAILFVGPAIGSRINVSQAYFITKHLLFSFIGIIIMLFISCLNIKSFFQLSYFGFILFIILLIFVQIVGIEIKGSKRWIDLGIFSLQPSEGLKPFFIVLMAKLLTFKNLKITGFILSLLIIFIIDILLITEPDFGSVILYSLTYLTQIFITNISKTIFIFLMPLLIIILTFGIISLPHVRQRILLFFTGNTEEQYQIKKSLESIYNGGYFGKGVGEGAIKYQLPDSHTDYIFSTIGEECGYFFCLFLIICYMIIFLKNLITHIKEDNLLKKNIIYGIIAMLSIQTFINIAVSVNLIPSKGMTLPFISYGGSSIIANYILIGILLLFTRKNYKYNSQFIE